MKTCFYCCSYKIFQQLNIDGEPLNLYNHKGIKKENFIYLYPEENSSRTINPENFFNIKKELPLTDIVVIDRIHIFAELWIPSVGRGTRVFQQGFAYSQKQCRRGYTPFSLGHKTPSPVPRKPQRKSGPRCTTREVMTPWS